MTGNAGILKSFSWLLLADLVARAFGFLATSHIAHALSVAGFGVIGYGLSMAGFFLLIVDGGVAVVGSMEVSRNSERHAALVAHFLCAKFLFAAVCFPTFLVVCYLATSQPDFRLALFLSGLLLWTSCLRLDWFFVGVGATHIPAMGTFVSQTIFAAGVYLLVRTEADLIRVPLISILGEILASICVAWQFGRRVDFRDLKIEASRLHSSVKNCWPLISMQLLRHVSYTFDTVFISFALSLRAVGIYLAIYKVILMLIGIGGVYLQNLLPVMAKRLRDKPGEATLLLDRSLFWTAMIVIPSATGIAMTAGPLIGFLFGPAYTAGRLPLQILAVCAIFVTLNGNFRQTLIAADLQPVVLRLAAVTAGINVILNVVLILEFGIMGAALAAMISEFFFLVVTFVCLRRLLVKAAFWRPVLPAVVLSSLMAGIVMPVTHGNLWTTVPAGSAVYVLLFLLGSIISQATGWQIYAHDILPEIRRRLRVRRSVG